MPRSLTLSFDRPPSFYPVFCKLSQSLQMSSNSNSIDSVINRKQAVDLQLLVFAVWHKVAPPGFCNRGGKWGMGLQGSRVRSPAVPVVLSMYQRGSLLDGLAMYLSCDTKKFHDNESTHISHKFWTSTHRGVASPLLPGGATDIWTRTCESSSTSAVDVIFFLLLSIFFLSFSS